MKKINGLSPRCLESFRRALLLIMTVLISFASSIYAAPDAGKIEKDVTYGVAGGVSLKMDIYFPEKPPENAGPAILYVHGGAWIKGDKSSGAGIKVIPELRRRGYIVASVNYRLAPKHKFPAQIEDVKCAVRFLRAHAAEYNLDPDKIGALGGSAGGHLVALLGLSDDNSGFEQSGGYSDQSSRVRAVVDLFGPSDLPAAKTTDTGLLSKVFGSDDETLKSASPVTYISKDDPPFLIVHGDKDSVVPFSQSQELYDRLIDSGLTATLVKVRSAGHGFTSSGGKIEPTKEQITEMIADFFDKYLK